MNESAACHNCGNVNQVKISSGFKKPENKGRKYFTCANCQQFNWVEDGVGVSASGLKVDYSLTPDKKPPTPKPVHEMADMENDESPSDYLNGGEDRESLDQGPDWDEIRRQGFRLRVAMEFIKGGGQVPLTPELKAYINAVVDYSMTGN